MMSTRRKQYRVYGNGVLLSEPGISARDMKSLVALIRANGRKVRVDEYSGRHDIWITTQDDGGYMDVLFAKKNRNKSGGRVTYTVATIDPYTQRRTSRLGRQVSKREAMKVADLWERNGAQNVCVIDSKGIIHRQPSNHASNRNRSGAQGRLVRFMPMATQWEQYSGWEGHAFADPSNDGYYHVTWRHHRDGMPTYVHAQHLSFRIRKFSKRFAA